MNGKFPDAKIALSKMDGNAVMIIGYAQTVLRRAGASNDEIEQFTKEASSGDYDNMLSTVIRWLKTC